MINGRDLINAGIPGGPYFNDLLNFSKTVTGNHDEIIAKVVDYYHDNHVIVPRSLHNRGSVLCNIESSNEYEEENMREVVATMTEASRTPTVVNAAILPDACPSGGFGMITVGGVIATENAIHPGFHSADVCCSVMATNLGDVDAAKVMEAVDSSTGFGPYYRNDKRDNPYHVPDELLARMRANRFLNNEKILERAVTQMGTQGDGNHFYFVGRSKNTGDVHIVSHHGCRGVGAMLYKIGMKLAVEYTRLHSPETIKANSWIEANSDIGQDYWEALQIVRDWTKLNHSVVHDRVADDFNGVHDQFWNEHNFVFNRNNIFYHAKGATPAYAGFSDDCDENGRTLVPLNMSEPVLVTRGLDNPNALGFSPHGAGRNFSRSTHKKMNAGRDNLDIFHEETRGLDVRFQAGDIDISELPSAYKNASHVKKQIEDMELATIEDEILPYGSIMAGHVAKHWER